MKLVKWAMWLAKYSPTLLHWWVSQKWLPSASVVEKNPRFFNTRDIDILKIIPGFPMFTKVINYTLSYLSSLIQTQYLSLWLKLLNSTSCYSFHLVVVSVLILKCETIGLLKLESMLALPFSALNFNPSFNFISEFYFMLLLSHIFLISFIFVPELNVV